MKDCVFCGIVEGKIPAHRISETEDFIAFLGIFPKNPGMTIIATKEHTGSYLYQTLSDDELSRMHLFAKKVALAIDKTLGSTRCVQVMEGLEVDHPHLKLYPVYAGIGDYRGESQEKAPDGELAEVATKIRKAGGLN